MWDWMVFNLAITCVAVYTAIANVLKSVFSTPFGVGVACNYLFPFYFSRGIVACCHEYAHIHTYTCTRTQTQSHVTCIWYAAHMKESCHAWIICHIHMIRHTYESVMSYIARDDATNEHVYVYEWAMSTYIICHIYQCGISNIYDAWRIWISHVTHDRGRCTRWASIYDMSHVSMSHLTHMNASCFTYK